VGLTQSLAGSALLHAGVLAVLLAFAPGAAGDRSAVAAGNSPPTRVFFPSHIVYRPSTGKGTGGGGGGNEQPGPIRRAESIGHDAITLRIRKPIATSGTAIDVETSLPALVLDARPLASGTFDVVGLPDRGVSVGTSTGPGSGGGVGDGSGSGIGSGRGSGMGPGSGGGTGGGVYRPGGSVTTPQLVSQVRPRYTPGALERRVQGSVVLEIVVTAQGLPTSFRIAQSLDLDLDKEAIKAVEQWRFRPGRLSGTPVDVLVTVVLDFTIR
jgi:periplasmic protein TonB